MSNLAMNRGGTPLQTSKLTKKIRVTCFECWSVAVFSPLSRIWDRPKAWSLLVGFFPDLCALCELRGEKCEVTTPFTWETGFPSFSG